MVRVYLKVIEYQKASNNIIFTFKSSFHIKSKTLKDFVIDSFSLFLTLFEIFPNFATRDAEVILV